MNRFLAQVAVIRPSVRLRRLMVRDPKGWSGRVLSIRLPTRRVLWPIAKPISDDELQGFGDRLEFYAPGQMPEL
jgi:hypothetical protein